MGDFICGLLVAIAVSVVFVSALLSSGYVFDKAAMESIGTTYPELSGMKEECEHSLPRNQHCVASIIFLPTASEE